MFRFIAGLAFSALALSLGFAPNASAAAISGAYAYQYVSSTSATGCSAYGGNPWTDNFNSTGGGNSISSAPVSFSICDGVSGELAGGAFLVSDGLGDTFSGTFTGVLTGTSAGGGDIFDGTFAETSASGTYASLTAVHGVLEVVTGQVETPAFLTGSFDFQSTPEPVPTALGGCGLLLMGLSRRLLKRRA